MPKEPNKDLESIIGNPNFDALNELLDQIEELYDEDSADKIEMNLKLITGRYSDGIIMHKMFQANESFDELVNQLRSIYSENHENMIINALAACIKDLELDVEVKKQRAEGKNRTVKRGEIYWCELTGIVGSEASGERPVLIISNDVNNLHSSKINAVLLSTKTRNNAFSEPINQSDLISGNIVQRTRAITTDILSIEKVRLGNKRAVVKDAKMNLIAEKVKKQLGL